MQQILHCSFAHSIWTQKELQGTGTSKLFRKRSGTSQLAFHISNLEVFHYKYYHTNIIRPSISVNGPIFVVIYTTFHLFHLPAFFKYRLQFFGNFDATSLLIFNEQIVLIPLFSFGEISPQLILLSDMSFGNFITEHTSINELDELVADN